MRSLFCNQVINLEQHPIKVLFTFWRSTKHDPLKQKWLSSVPARFSGTIQNPQFHLAIDTKEISMNPIHNPSVSPAIAPELLIPLPASTGDTPLSTPRSSIDEKKSEALTPFPPDSGKRHQILKTMDKPEADDPGTASPVQQGKLLHTEAPGRDNPEIGEELAEHQTENGPTRTRLHDRRPGELRTFLEGGGAPPFNLNLEHGEEQLSNNISDRAKPSYANELGHTVDVFSITLHRDDANFRRELKAGDVFEWDEHEIFTNIALLNVHQEDFRAELQSEYENGRLNGSQFKRLDQTSKKITARLNSVDDDYKRPGLERTTLNINLLLLCVVASAVQLYVPYRGKEEKYAPIMFAATLYAGIQLLGAVFNKASNTGTFWSMARRKYMVNMLLNAPFLIPELGGKKLEHLATDAGFNTFVMALGLLGFLTRAEPKAIPDSLRAVYKKIMGTPPGQISENSRLAEMVALIKCDMHALDEFRSKFIKSHKRLSSIQNDTITDILRYYARVLEEVSTSLPAEPADNERNSSGPNNQANLMGKLRSSILEKLRDNHDWKEKLATSIFITGVLTAAIPLMIGDAIGVLDLTADDIGVSSDSFWKTLNRAYNKQSLEDNVRDLAGLSMLMIVFLGADKAENFLGNSPESYFATGGLAVANLLVKGPIGKLGGDGIMLLMNAIENLGKKETTGGSHSQDTGTAMDDLAQVEEQSSIELSEHAVEHNRT